LRTPHQLRKSWYCFYFQPPGLPESTARSRNWQFLRNFMRDANPGSFTPQDLQSYIKAWSQPGTATGMINYYRSSVRNTHAEEQLRTVEAPTLVIWGQDDRYLGQELAEPLGSDVPNLAGVQRILNASHWVHHDAPEQVTRLMVDFFAPARTR